MKKGLHPDYNKTKIECACGNSFETRSTGSEQIKVDLCSACHPFYTGKQKFIDSAGRVDKFRARMEAAQKNTKNEKSDTQKSEEATKDNTEKLKEIKSQISEKPKAPFEVTQENNSDTEIAAAEELELSQAEEKAKEQTTNEK